MEPKLFVQALFDWEDFWATVRTWWSLLGDPRCFSPAEMEKWLREPAFPGTGECQDWLKILRAHLFWESLMAKYPLHPIWITGLTLTIAEISEEEKLRRIRKRVKMFPKSVPEHPLFFDALGSTILRIEDFKVDESIFNEICKEIGQEGTQEQILPVLQNFSEKLREGISIPTFLGALCLAAHRATDWLGLEIINSQFWIYAFSGGELSPLWPFPSPSMENYDQEYVYLEEFKDAVKKVSCQGRTLSNTELEQMLIPNEDGRFENKYKQLDCNASHPLHRLIGRSKFIKGGTPWSAEQVARIDEEINACLEGTKSIEKLVIEEMLRQLERTGEREKFLKFFSNRANEVYRRVYERFRRRGAHMPRLPKGWRKRALQQVRGLESNFSH